MANNPEKVARIFLIDDHPVVRQGLALLLAQESHLICGEAGNRGETLARIASAAAEVALLDLSLGEESGFDLIATLREQGVAVLIYSMHEDAETIERAFGDGANGYVSKREGSEVLLGAVTQLLGGGRYVSPRAAQSLASKALAAPPEEDREVLLSEREKQTLILLGRGESSVDIGAAFGISVRTVETYYARIIGKLRIENMKELRRYAIRNHPR